jgi:hypothetical protein
MSSYLLSGSGKSRNPHVRVGRWVVLSVRTTTTGTRILDEHLMPLHSTLNDEIRRGSADTHSTTHPHDPVGLLLHPRVTEVTRRPRGEKERLHTARGIGA